MTHCFVEFTLNSARNYLGFQIEFSFRLLWLQIEFNLFVELLQLDRNLVRQNLTGFAKETIVAKILLMDFDCFEIECLMCLSSCHHFLYRHLQDPQTIYYCFIADNCYMRAPGAHHHLYRLHSFQEEVCFLDNLDYVHDLIHL